MRLDEYCRAVGRDCRLNMTDRAVMWTMQTYVYRKTGETYVSLAKIAADLCVDTRSVRRAVHRLESFGIIAGQPRVGRTTLYRFPLHPAVTAATPDIPDRGPISTTPGESDRGGSPQPLSTVAHTPVNGDHDPCHQCPPNHVDNHVKEPRAADLNDDTPIAVPASVAELLRPFASIGARR